MEDKKTELKKDITQMFYNNMASQYDKLFLDWQATVLGQAELLSKVFQENGYDYKAKILDCACGIGTQSIGLAKLGYNVIGSDISDGEIAEARIRAKDNNVNVRFEQADFCALSQTFKDGFDIIIAMDNALPHMLSHEALASAIKSIAHQTRDNGMFVASIRDYDKLLQEKPSYSAPYIYETQKGQRISFQTWKWLGDNYKFTQYIIDDEGELQIHKFDCEYRATMRQELTDLLIANGFNDVIWKMPDEIDFYQPVVIAKK